MNRRARPVSGRLLLRLGFPAAGMVAPSLAARAAERLFYTPPRHRPSRREREAIAEGDAFALAVNGETLRGWRFGAGPAVVLVHGWGGGAGQLGAFIAPLLSAGCSAVAFDAPGHGSSSGRLSSGINFADAVSAVAESVRARSAIGHSIGATAVGWAVAGGLRLDAVRRVRAGARVLRA
jgi:alpha-beta hydrolase superfamily lysophospholipase